MIRPACAAAALAALVLAGPACAAETDPAPATDLSQRPGTLSDKLNSSDGVIRPQDGMDDGMHKTPPADSRMPVIPPTGSSGASPDGVPK